MRVTSRRLLVHPMRASIGFPSCQRIPYNERRHNEAQRSNPLRLTTKSPEDECSDNRNDENDSDGYHTDAAPNGLTDDRLLITKH